MSGQIERCPDDKRDKVLLVDDLYLHLGYVEQLQRRGVVSNVWRRGGRCRCGRAYARRLPVCECPGLVYLQVLGSVL